MSFIALAPVVVSVLSDMTRFNGIEAISHGWLKTYDAKHNMVNMQRHKIVKTVGYKD